MSISLSLVFTIFTFCLQTAQMKILCAKLIILFQRGKKYRCKMRRVDWKWGWKAVKNSGLHGFKSLGRLLAVSGAFLPIATVRIV